MARRQPATTIVLSPRLYVKLDPGSLAKYLLSWRSSIKRERE
jgi:hypothetical protein